MILQKVHSYFPNSAGIHRYIRLHKYGWGDTMDIQHVHICSYIQYLDIRNPISQPTYLSCHYYAPYTISVHAFLMDLDIWNRRADVCACSV